MATTTFYYFLMSLPVSHQQKMKSICLPHPRHKKRFRISRVLIFPVTAIYDCHASVKTQQNEARKKKCKNAVVVVQMLCGDRRKWMLNLGRDLWFRGLDFSFPSVPILPLFTDERISYYIVYTVFSLSSSCLSLLSSMIIGFCDYFPLEEVKFWWIFALHKSETIYRN